MRNFIWRRGQGLSHKTQAYRFLSHQLYSLFFAPPGQDSPSVTAVPLPADALQNLVVLSHNHSQECAFIPDVKSLSLTQKGASGGLVWECLAGHTFSWSPPNPPPFTPPPRKAASRRREEKMASSKTSPPPSPIIRPRRSLRRAAAAHAFSLALASDSPCPVDEAEPPSKEDGQGSVDQEQTVCLSPGGGTGPGEEAVLLDSDKTETGKGAGKQLDTSMTFTNLEAGDWKSSLLVEGKREWLGMLWWYMRHI